MSKTAPQSESYVAHVARLEERLSTDDALRRAVGGEFVAVGKLEYYLLRSRGLKDHHLVVDVGCGSGRLACQLAPFPGIRYIGCDVVPRLLEYAGELCARPDWRFEHTNGTAIPCADDQADVVCFFSVFTHLRQEEIYRYFREAYRVLKPGGQMILSFLEFRVPSHWAAFIASVDQTREDQHLNQFVERDSIHAWAAPAGFDVRSIHGGDTQYIPLPEEIVYESGARLSGAGSLGQSVAILQKRAKPSSDHPPESAGLRPETPPAASPAAGSALPLAAPRAPLVNLSARARVAPRRSATAGFILGPGENHRVLVRAIGPGLAVFGVPDGLEDPTLAIYADGTERDHNLHGWGGDPQVAAAAAVVGAFDLAPQSRDAALIATLAPGSYSAVVTSASGTNAGEVLIEVYLID